MIAALPETDSNSNTRSLRNFIDQTRKKSSIGPGADVQQREWVQENRRLNDIRNANNGLYSMSDENAMKALAKYE